MNKQCILHRFEVLHNKLGGSISRLMSKSMVWNQSVGNESETLHGYLPTPLLLATTVLDQRLPCMTTLIEIQSFFSLLTVQASGKYSNNFGTF